VRRADRLFQIVQFLRSRRLTTADWLAEKLEVSVRTIYRDIADLSASGVPLEGEAGIGYVLRHKLDLPPLMFDRKELSAIELGLRFVSTYSSRSMALAALSAMSKVRTSLPRVSIEKNTLLPLFVPNKEGTKAPSFEHVLTAIEEREKIHIHYNDANSSVSERVVWPLGVFFWGSAWTVLSWCELRQDFRSFRLERIAQINVLDENYPDYPGRRLADYFRSMETMHAVPMSDFDPL
jgi:predicted DNA-binding transcriptional regulator YafY